MYDVARDKRTTDPARGRGRAGDRAGDGVLGKVDHLAAKAAMLEVHAAKHAAVAAKLSKQAGKVAAKAKAVEAHLDQGGDLRSALGVWTRAEPGSRRPRFTREDIAAAAVRIADAEGFDALSMRRLAAELDAGTMTLYHYVRTKDELLALVVDAIMGEVALPEGVALPSSWRAAVHAIARRTRECLRRHPWVLDIQDDPGIGPNSVRHFDQSLAAAALFSGAFEDQLDLVFAVDEYVFGFCMQERNNYGDDQSGDDDAVIAYVDGLVHSGRFERLAELVDRLGTRVTWERIAAHGRDPKRFERNLDRLLDGFAAQAGRRRR